MSSTPLHLCLRVRYTGAKDHHRLSSETLNASYSTFNLNNLSFDQLNFAIIFWRFLDFKVYFGISHSNLIRILRTQVLPVFDPLSYSDLNIPMTDSKLELMTQHCR
jgi:hypothetical protein